MPTLHALSSPGAFSTRLELRALFQERYVRSRQRYRLYMRRGQAISSLMSTLGLNFPYRNLLTSLPLLLLYAPPCFLVSLCPCIAGIRHVGHILNHQTRRNEALEAEYKRRLAQQQQAAAHAAAHPTPPAAKQEPEPADSDAK